MTARPSAPPRRLLPPACRGGGAGAARPATDAQWLERLDSERDNLRAALTWAAESGETEVGLRTGRRALAVLADAGRRRRGPRASRPPAHRSVPGSPSIRAFAQSRAASLAFYQGDFDAVHRYLEASLPVHRELGDDFNLSSYLGVLALTALAEGDADEARALAEEALEAGAAGAQSDERGVCPGNVSASCSGSRESSTRRNVCSRRACGERASSETSAASDPGRKLWAESPSCKATYPRARELFEQSLAILRSLDDAWGILGSLSGLALVALEEHDNEAARRLLDESLELLRKSGHHYRAANSLELAARLAAAQDRDRRAARLYGAASVFRGSIGAGMFECEVWPDPAPHIARLRSVLGEPAFAETWAQGTAMTLDEALTYALEEKTILRPSSTAERTTLLLERSK